VPVRVRTRGIHDRLGRVVGVLQAFEPLPDGTLPDQLRQHLEGFAYLDPTTALANGAYIAKAVATRHALLADAALGLLMVDVDRFSAINDGHGPAVGDAVLRALARTTAGAISPVDQAARWRDDRLMVLLDRAGPARLREVADRIAALAGLTRVDGSAGPLRPSVSVAGVLVRAEDPVDDAIARLERLADRAEEEGPGCISLDAAA